MIPAVQPDPASRGPRRPTFDRRELALMVLAVACVIAQVIVYRGPQPGTAARVAVVVFGLGTFGSFIAMAVLAVRRGQAQRRAPD